MFSHSSHLSFYTILVISAFLFHVGMVLAVQKALETLVSLLRFVLTLAMPLPRQFGTLVFITFLAICAATACFAFYMVRVARAHAPADKAAASAGGRTEAQTQAPVAAAPDKSERTQQHTNGEIPVVTSGSSAPHNVEEQSPAPLAPIGELDVEKTQTQDALPSALPITMRASESAPGVKRVLCDSGTTAGESPRATDPLELPDASSRADQQQQGSEREPLCEAAADGTNERA